MVKATDIIGYGEFKCEVQWGNQAFSTALVVRQYVCLSLSLFLSFLSLFFFFLSLFLSFLSLFFFFLSLSHTLSCVLSETQIKECSYTLESNRYACVCVCVCMCVRVFFVCDMSICMSMYVCMCMYVCRKSVGKQKQTESIQTSCQTP